MSREEILWIMLVWRIGSKRSDQEPTVMRRVLEGGEGCINGGRLDRSSVREVRDGFCDGLDMGDSGGEADILILMQLRSEDTA